MRSLFLNLIAEKGDEEKESLLDRLHELEVFGSSAETSGMLEKFSNDLRKAPAPKQMAVGGVAGWCAGYLTMKAGKMAATAIGGTLLLLQIAHHKGYVKVDWNKMTSDSATVADKIQEKLHIKSKSSMEKFQDWSAKNIYLAGGFTGGFFLGIASS